MKDFILKLVIYLLVLGIPASILTFFVLGCIWLWNQNF